MSSQIKLVAQADTFEAHDTIFEDSKTYIIK